MQNHLKDLRWSFLQKQSKDYHYFSKAVHLRSSKFQEISGIFRHIHVLFRHIQPYCGIFKTMCNSCIFKTLPYSESWHILDPKYIQSSVKAYSGIFSRLCNPHILENLLYSELCHIQNFGNEKLEVHSESCLFRHI